MITAIDFAVHIMQELAEHDSVMFEEIECGEDSTSIYYTTCEGKKYTIIITEVD